MLTLEKEDRGKKRKRFDDKKFTRAARLLHKVGQFTPEMMSEPAVMGVIEETYGALAEAIDSSLRHETPDNVRHALQENAFIFSGFKTYHSLREVGLSLTDEKGDIKPFETFLGDVKRINALYNHNYLYAEYNHAVASALMADKWKQYEADGDKYYLQYRTAKDDRVRETHRALHGTTLPASDEFWDSFLPPNGWNCRCSTVQVRKEDYQPSDHDLAMKRGNNVTEGAKNAIFRFNPGKTLRLFPPKHPYFPKNCGDCKRNLNLAYSPSNEKCQVCELLQYIKDAKKEHIEKNRSLYGKLIKDDKYKNVAFDEKNGGLKATHIGHNLNKDKGWYETTIQDVGYKHGHSVILEDEPQNVYKGKSCEGLWDNLKFEVAGAESGTSNNIRNALKHCASKPESKIAVLFFPNGNFSEENFQAGLAKFKGLKGTSQYKKFDLIYCIQGTDIVQIKKPS